MAYKFQRGEAILSGSITAEEGFDAGDANIKNVGDIALDSISADGSAIEITLTDNDAAALEIKEGSTSYLKVTTQNGAEGLIAGEGMIVSADKSLSLDIDGENALKFNSTLDALQLFATGGLGDSGVAMEFLSAGETISFNDMLIDGHRELRLSSSAHSISADASTVIVKAASGTRGTFKNGGLDVVGAVSASTSFIIGNADLNEADLEQIDGLTAGTVTASKAVVVDSNKDISEFRNLQAVQLSASSNIVIGNADISEADLEKIDGITDGTGAANKALVLDASGDITSGLRNLTVEGNLTVTGTTVEVDAAFIVTSSIQFEGSIPDGNELTLTTANPTADRTVTIPDLDGHVPLLAGAISSANVTAAEFALLDGDSTVQSRTGGAALVGTDGFLCNNGGTMEQVDLDSLATFVGNNIAETVQNVNSDSNLSSSAGAIVLAQSASSAYTLTLEPAADSSGKIFKVKREDGQNVTIAAAGSETIDGDASIVLESDYAAVMLFSNGSNYFVI